MTIDPTFSAAVQLRKWYDTEPHPDSFGSRCNENVSARHLNDSLPNDIIFIADVYESDMGSQTPQTFTIRAMVRLIYSEKIDDIVYPACRNCSRRVTLVDGIWQCGKCKEDFARLEYRWGHTHTQIYVFSSTPSWRNFSYKLNMKVKDLSGEMTLSGFNNIGLSLFDGMPAEQLVNIQVMRSTKMITPCMYRWFFCREKTIKLLRIQLIKSLAVRSTSPARQNGTITMWVILGIARISFLNYEWYVGKVNCEVRCTKYPCRGLLRRSTTSDGVAGVFVGSECKMSFRVHCKTQYCTIKFYSFHVVWDTSRIARFEICLTVQSTVKGVYDLCLVEGQCVIYFQGGLM